MIWTKWYGVHPFDRFVVEVVRFCSPLFDEKSTEIQVALFACQAIKADQSQLYFRMSAIPGQLLRSGAKNGHQMIRQTSNNIEQGFLTGRLPVYDCRLDQVTGAIQFMQVAKVFETVTWPPGKNVAVQVTIGLLGVCEELYGPVNESFDLIVGMVLEISTGGLKPLRHVRIPENAASPIP